MAVGKYPGVGCRVSDPLMKPKNRCVEYLRIVDIVRETGVDGWQVVTLLKKNGVGPSVAVRQAGGRKAYGYESDLIRRVKAWAAKAVKSEAE